MNASVLLVTLSPFAGHLVSLSTILTHSSSPPIPPTPTSKGTTPSHPFLTSLPLTIPKSTPPCAASPSPTARKGFTSFSTSAPGASFSSAEARPAMSEGEFSVRICNEGVRSDSEIWQSKRNSLLYRKHDFSALSIRELNDTHPGDCSPLPQALSTRTSPLLCSLSPPR